MINNNLSNKHNTLIMYRSACFYCFFNVFTLFIFYSVYVLQIYSVRWIENYRKGQETLVEICIWIGKEKEEESNEASANKQKGAIHTFKKMI